MIHLLVGLVKTNVGLSNLSAVGNVSGGLDSVIQTQMRLPTLDMFMY